MIERALVVGSRNSADPALWALVRPLFAGSESGVSSRHDLPFSVVLIARSPPPDEPPPAPHRGASVPALSAALGVKVSDILRALRLLLSGKVAGGEVNHLVLRFAVPKGNKDVGALTNRLRDRWGEVSGEITPPEDAVSLEWVYLYRLKQRGTAWYGPLRVERADAPRGGADVSSRVQGTFPVLRRGELHTVRYRDAEASTVGPRVRVRLLVP